MEGGGGGGREMEAHTQWYVDIGQLRRQTVETLSRIYIASSLHSLIRNLMKVILARMHRSLSFQTDAQLRLQ